MQCCSSYSMVSLIDSGGSLESRDAETSGLTPYRRPCYAPGVVLLFWAAAMVWLSLFAGRIVAEPPEHPVAFGPFYLHGHAVILAVSRRFRRRVSQQVLVA